MKRILTFLYLLTLSLWIGGMTMLSLIATPALFARLGRDQAGEAVSAFIHPYFGFNLALSLIALALILSFGTERRSRGFKVKVVLTLVAVIANAYVLFGLFPRMEEIRSEVDSFEVLAKDHPQRKEFGRLHGFSSSLSLLVLLDGVALLWLGGLSSPKKEEDEDSNPTLTP